MYISALMRKWTPFRDHIDVAFLWIKEVGILQYQVEFWDVKPPTCVHEKNFVVVELNDMLPAFYLIAFGALISLSVVLLEIIWKRIAMFVEERNDMKVVIL